jgi:hypothetical protein
MPNVFGLEHFIYLCLVIIIMGLSLTFIKKKVRKDRTISLIIKGLGFFLLCAIIWNRISIAIGRDDIFLLWPDSYCGTSSFVIAITVMFGKKDNIVLHGVAYLGLVGGLVTLIYPDFIDQADSIFYPMTISGLLHHTLMLWVILIMLITGYLKPSLKKWSSLPIGLCIFLTYGIFLITVIGLDDAMYINQPVLENTSLNWFVLGAILLPIHFLFLVMVEWFRKKRFVVEAK